MRTTIDIPDEQRAKLLQIAAQRGEKGFSKLVQEALERYLDELAKREGRIRQALSVIGQMDEETAGRLEEEAGRLRASWR
jgi:metal-responsive CopG/Arc/MetJ family transcriptional regulator